MFFRKNDRNLAKFTTLSCYFCSLNMKFASNLLSYFKKPEETIINEEILYDLNVSFSSHTERSFEVQFLNLKKKICTERDLLKNKFENSFQFNKVN